MQVVLRTEVETEGMILGRRASGETDPAREEKVHFACTCQNQSNFNHIRDSLGASLRGAFSPYALRLVYDRMLACMEPSSTYPDGQLALVVQLMGRFVLIFFFHRSLVAAEGKRCVGRSAETLQGKGDTVRLFPHFPISLLPAPSLGTAPASVWLGSPWGHVSQQLPPAAWKHIFRVPSSPYRPSSRLDLKGHFPQKHQERGWEELWAKEHGAKEGKPQFMCLVNSKKRSSTNTKKCNSINATPSKINPEESSRPGGTFTALNAAEPLAEGRAAALTSAEVYFAAGHHFFNVA